MTIVSIPGQYDQDLRTFGHIPGGPRGSALGAIARVSSRYAYRGGRRLFRYIFSPGKKTITKAVRRGTAVGIGIGSLLPGFDDLDIATPVRPTQRPRPNRFQQRNSRRKSANRCRRRNQRYCSC